MQIGYTGLYFSYKRKLNYIYFGNVKPYITAKIKNVFVNSMHYVTEYNVFNIVFIRGGFFVCERETKCWSSMWFTGVLISP
jgi:hypothetical protein